MMFSAATAYVVLSLLLTRVIGSAFLGFIGTLVAGAITLQGLMHG